MEKTTIEAGKRYRAKVIGANGIREVEAINVMNNVVVCRDLKLKQNVVAKITDLEPIS